jgi:SpoVK/Ycf46/Vps4 family AAA+-type ATPase
VQQNFFAQNQGLDRRFPWKYTIEPYTAEELNEIFVSQVTQEGYKLADDVDTPSLFKETDSLFEHGGGDTETFLSKCIMIHEKRTIARPSEQGTLSKVDISKGLDLHKEHKKKEESKLSDAVLHMYS